MTNPNYGENLFAEIREAFTAFREELEKEFSEISNRVKADSSEDAPEEGKGKGVTWEELSDWFDEHDTERINPLGDLGIGTVSADDVKDSAEAWEKQQDDYMVKMWARGVVPLFPDDEVVAKNIWQDYILDNLVIDGQSYWQIATSDARRNFLIVVDDIVELVFPPEWGTIAKTCDQVWKEIEKLKSRPYAFHSHFSGRVSIDDITALVQKLKNLKRVA